MLEYTGEKRNSSALYLCKCDCGTIKKVPSIVLRRGQSKSCGCSKAEFCAKAHTIHNGKGTRLYVVWLGMIQRCENPNQLHYKHYGGRGISVCGEWHDFDNFRDWAMKHGYDPKAKRGDCTIDRINNDGNYCPDNCRWTTMKEQRINQRKRSK